MNQFPQYFYALVITCHAVNLLNLVCEWKSIGKPFINLKLFLPVVPTIPICLINNICNAVTVRDFPVN